jgi:hypothetical protein
MASKKHQRLVAGRSRTVWRRGNTSRLNRQHPWRQACATHKVRYPNPENARMVAAMSDGAIYRCPTCDGWHVTSQKRRS